MNKNVEQQKAIVRMRLHKAAGNPPEGNPFSREGAQAWNEYSAECRNMEIQLMEMGGANMNAEEIKEAMRDYISQQNKFDDICKSVIGRVAIRNLKHFVQELEDEIGDAEADQAHPLDCGCGQCSGEDAAIEAMERGIVRCETNYEGENF